MPIDAIAAQNTNLQLIISDDDLLIEGHSDIVTKAWRQSPAVTIERFIRKSIHNGDTSSLPEKDRDWLMKAVSEDATEDQRDKLATYAQDAGAIIFHEREAKKADPHRGPGGIIHHAYSVIAGKEKQFPEEALKPLKTIGNEQYLRAFAGISAEAPISECSKIILETMKKRKDNGCDDDTIHLAEHKRPKLPIPGSNEVLDIRGPELAKMREIYPDAPITVDGMTPNGKDYEKPLSLDGNGLCVLLVSEKKLHARTSDEIFDNITVPLAEQAENDNLYVLAVSNDRDKPVHELTMIKGQPVPILHINQKDLSQFIENPELIKEVYATSYEKALKKTSFVGKERHTRSCGDLSSYAAAELDKRAALIEPAHRL